MSEGLSFVFLLSLRSFNVPKTKQRDLPILPSTRERDLLYVDHRLSYSKADIKGLVSKMKIVSVVKSLCLFLVFPAIPSTVG